MGWSIDIVRPQLDKLLKDNEYRIEHPDAISPRVNIYYEGDMDRLTMREVVNLFPDFVYVNLMKESAESIDNRQ